MNFLPDFIDFSLIDVEKMTPEKWRNLIMSKIDHKKNDFIEELKNKVIHDVNMCIINENNDPAIEAIRINIIKKIKENQFEHEYRRFIDGLVDSTFEFVCKFIIKNSMENIKRTQNALHSFSLETDTSLNILKIDEDSSKLTPMHYSPESNDHVADSNSEIHYNLFNKSSQNNGSFLINETGNSNKNLPLSEVSKLIDNNIENNSKTVSHSSINIDVDDDAKTTQSIMSIALNISQKEIGFKYAFEDENITDMDNPSNEIQTSPLLVSNSLLGQNEEQSSDNLKSEEECKMNYSLNILKNLANVQNDELEVQKSFTENESQQLVHNTFEIQKDLTENKSQQSSIDVYDNKHDVMSNQLKLTNNESQKSKDKLHTKLDEDEQNLTIISANKNSKNKGKSLKKYNYENKTSKTSNKKLKGLDNLDSLSLKHSNNSVGLQDDQNISSAVYNNMTEMSISGSSNNKIFKTVSRKESDVTNSIIKDNYDIITQDFEELPLITNLTEPTTSNNQKNEDKPSNSIISGMKTKDYKKLYEKDRKSLFSPDIIINANSINDTQLKNVNNPTKQPDDSDKKNQQDKKQTNKRKKNSNSIKVKFIKPKGILDTTFLSNSSSSVIDQSSTTVNRNKYKRPKTDNANKRTTKKNKKLKTTSVTSNIESDPTDNSVSITNTNNGLDLDSMPQWLRAKCIRLKIKPVYVVIN